MELESGSDYAPVEVSKAFESAICLQDLDTGDAVYLDAEQVKHILPLLQSFAKTGELQE